MPRIGALLGALATVAFCIGFNIFRYPKVWEMAVALPDANRVSQQTLFNAPPIAQPANAAPATKSAPATAASRPAPATKIVRAEKPRGKAAKVAAKNAAITLSSDSRSMAKTKPAGEKPKPATAQPPKNVETAKAHSAGVKKTPQAANSKPAPTFTKTAEHSPVEESRRPLVSVTQNALGRDHAAASETTVAQVPLEVSASNQTCVIRRLPPVDPFEPRRRPTPLSPLGPIPIYPTTGVN